MNLQKKETDLLLEISQASITVVSHDAGGANVLEAFIRAHNLTVNKLIISGPATKIFGIEKKQEATLETSRPEVVLASTGWQTDFEVLHIDAEVSQAKRVIVFLDHWTNFEQRLKFHSKNILVPELVTFDEKAMRIASRTFPGSQIYCFTNYYLQEQSVNISKNRIENQDFIYDYLFIGEPIRDKNYSEEDSFRYFVSKITQTGNSHPSVAVRPHPSQSREMYLAMVAKFANFPITVTEETSLHQDLSNSKFVVGCFSMALELARMSGIPVYSAVPELEQNQIHMTHLSRWDPK
jgi:hypothetical protein